jgi:hypothetical protein
MDRKTRNFFYKKIFFFDTQFEADVKKKKFFYENEIFKDIFSYFEGKKNLFALTLRISSRKKKLI